MFCRLSGIKEQKIVPREDQRDETRFTWSGQTFDFYLKCIGIGIRISTTGCLTQKQEILDSLYYEKYN